MENSMLEFADTGVRHDSQSMHSHCYAELYISLEGRTTDIVNGVAHVTYPLDVFVLTEDMTHGQINTDNYRYCIFKFDMERLIASAGHLLSEPAFEALFITEPKQRREGVQQRNLQIDAATAEYAELTAKILMHEDDRSLGDRLFLSLITLVVKRVHQADRVDTTPSEERIADVLSFMERHYMDNLTLDILANRAGYSKRHFSRLFISLCVDSPMEYLKQLRLRKAVKLLHEKKLGIEEIAEMCGFGDCSMFSKAFRKQYGTTPSAYRRSCLPSDATTTLQGVYVTRTKD